MKNLNVLIGTMVNFHTSDGLSGVGVVQGYSFGFSEQAGVVPLLNIETPGGTLLTGISGTAVRKCVEA